MTAYPATPKGERRPRVVAIAVVVAVIIVAVGVWASAPWRTERSLESLAGVEHVHRSGTYFEVVMNCGIDAAASAASYRSILATADSPVLGRIVITHGPISTTVLSPAPGVAPHQPAGDAAALLCADPHIASATLDFRGTLDVSLLPGTDVAEWMRMAVGTLAELGRPMRIDAADGEKAISLSTGEQWQLDLYDQVATTAPQASIIEFAVGQNQPPDVEVDLSVTDREAAGATGAALTQWAPTVPVTLTGTMEVADALVIEGITDPEAAFEAVADLEAAGGRVLRIDTSVSEVFVGVDDPAELGALADGLPGMSLSATTLVRVDGAGWVSGTAADMPERLGIAQRLWTDGWPEVRVIDPNDSGLTHQFSIPADPGYASPQAQREVFAAIRAAGWTGVSKISVVSPNDTQVLSFRSTPDGTAQRISGTAEWMQPYVAAWNATAG
ncbi:MAG: hypothetical protein ACK5KO_07945 [Arachnia sp.]